MIKLKEKPLSAFPKKLQEYFHKISISSDFNIIGSSSYKNFLYNNDYDLNEYYKAKDTPTILNKLYHNFLDKFLIAEKDPNQFITDFKCGELNNEPIRWNISQMKKGYQIINHHKITFQDSLLMKSTIKLDEIILIGNLFYDITNNYFLNIGTHSNYQVDNGENMLTQKESKLETIKNLENDYIEQVDDGNYFKAIKRKSSIYILKHNNHISKKLLDLLNSDDGRLYKVINDLNVIILLSENKDKKPSINILHENLQMIKYFASKISHMNLDFAIKEIDNICHFDQYKEIIQRIEKLNKQLNKLLNKSVKKFIS